MNMYTYEPPCSKETLERLYCIEKKTQIEIAHVLGVSLKPVQTAMRRFGIKARAAVPRDQRGSRNRAWKADAAGYQAMHLRVDSLRGKPKRCEQCGIDDENKIYDWANLTGRYNDPFDFARLCRSCHRLMDNRKRKTQSV